MQVYVTFRKGSVLVAQKVLFIIQEAVSCSMKKCLLENIRKRNKSVSKMSKMLYKMLEFSFL